MKLSDVLEQKDPAIHTAAPDDPVIAAVHRLVTHNIGALAIVDSNSRLIGILSERDVLRLVSRDPSDLTRGKIADYMTQSVITGDLASDVEDSLSVMSSNRIRHLPVVDSNRKLIGMISQGDLVKAKLDQAEFETRQMTDMVMGKYPG